MLLETLKAITRPVRRRARVLLGRDLSFAPEIRVPVEVHGTEYGGFALLRDSLTAQSTVLSFGIGEDASFDLSVIAQYGCTVCAFDPTPKSVAWVGRTVGDARFCFSPKAVAATDGTIRLYLPTNPAHVSASVRAGAHTRNEAVDVPGRRLATIVSDLNLETIDVLKMDIEGAEYAVLADYFATPGVPLPRQLAVEFHHFWPAFGLDATRGALALLRARGYRIAWVSPSHHELLFVRGQ